MIKEPGPDDLDAVSRALPAHGFTVQSTQLGYRPKNPVTLDDTARAEVEAFLKAISADDDVQNIEGSLNTPGGANPAIRSVWFVEAEEEIPQLVTAYPL